MSYKGHIAGYTSTLTSPLGRGGTWTCTHNHRQHGAAFECAVKRAKATVLKSPRGQRSAATDAGIRTLEIKVVQSD